MKYYDPWAHAVQIVFSRLLLFVAIDLTAVAITWWQVLDTIHVAGIGVFFASIGGLILGTQPIQLQVLFTLTVVCCTLAVSILFIFLLRTSRTRLYDRHRRGARVVDASSDQR
jgi:hypothetical protein